MPQLLNSQIQMKCKTMAIRILVVDDDRDNADLLGLLLLREGAQLCIKYSGKTALESLEYFDPDLAFIDIGMEEMDGCETAQNIRKHTKTKRIKLIALTGFGGLHDQIRIKRAGFDLHLIKPISALEISNILSESVNTAGTNVMNY